LGELFLLDPADIHRDIRNIMSIENERGVRLQFRLDPFERGLVVMVIMPKDRFNSEVRERIQKLLAERLEATYVDYRLAMVGDDEDQVRFHFFFATHMPYEALNVAELEKEVGELTRNWDDRLEEALSRLYGEKGVQLAARYSRYCSEGYKVEVPVEVAIRDIENLESLGDSRFRVDLLNPLWSRFPETMTHVRVYHPGTFGLNEFFPVLENFGLQVYEQISYQLVFGPDQIMSVDIFRVHDSVGQRIDIDKDGERLKSAVISVLTGVTQNDRLNRLVLGAGLTIREVGLLNTYRAHLFQLLPAASLTFITQTMLKYPEVIRLIFEFFQVKFEPGPTIADRQAGIGEARAAAYTGLDQVSTLPEDEILRAMIELVDATVRSNFYLGHDRISIKVESRKLLRIVEPRPIFEIFVTAPGLEAVHLRGAKVARGGLRWSDRPDDFRTEVLGLMKTQMTKNAVIVPEGSKGGFVLKSQPSDPAGMKSYVRHQYQTFIRGLLDLTDNIVDGEARHPAGLVIYDELDPYLVVAADKGTATFSDIANQVSAEYGFWLGDAFASGGSHGYDHKEEGITARGAWECVNRHFREIGINPFKDEFTVVGIGDMSGDVFGNGLIYSDKIRLLAAFNHTHIFIDPNPDAAKSFVERKRLFDNPSLTWNDYDRALISAGGGVFPRHAKSIPAGAEIRKLLAWDEDSMSGRDMVRRILQLPVDLLWNGGIGTYVKAGSESHAEVGDHSNDAVRIDASQVRAKVIGEGGNLGLTQRGRVEYALLGGRLNTDAIDNSGGVDMSDHEVNIKILLGGVQKGILPFEDRNRLLSELTEDVSRLVLAHNFDQALCLSMAERLGPAGIPLYESLQNHLASTGRLKPAVEFLPGHRELEQRQRSGKGYTRPELAILLAYTKMDIKRSLLGGSLPDEPALERHLVQYFPKGLQGRFAEQMRRHPLKREIIATVLTNLLVGRFGLGLIHRLREETQAQSEEVLRAVIASVEILRLEPLFGRVLALEGAVPVEKRYQAIERIVASTKAIAQWLLLSSDYEANFGKLVDRYQEPLQAMRQSIAEFLPPASEQRSYLAEKRGWLEVGCPEDVASDLAAAEYWASCMGVADIVRATGVPLAVAARRFYAVGDLFHLGWLRDQLSGLSSASMWEAVAVGGLIMDLRHVQNRLTVLSLGVGSGEGDSPEAFLKGRERLAERIKVALNSLREERTVDLAAGSAITRLLLQLQGSVQEGK